MTSLSQEKQEKFPSLHTPHASERIEKFTTQKVRDINFSIRSSEHAQCTVLDHLCKLKPFLNHTKPELLSEIEE